MNFISALRNWWNSTPSGTDGKGVVASSPSMPITDNAPAATIDSAMQMSAVYRGVEIIAKTVGSLPLMVYDDRKGRTVARNERLYQVLHSRPNPRMTAMLFWMTVMMNFVLRGTGYARIDRDEKGEVIALWPMATDQIKAIILEDGSLVFEYTVTGGVAILAESSVLRIADLGNGIVGFDRLGNMRASVGESINSQSHASKMFASAGKATGVLMIDKPLTKEQREQLRKTFSGLEDSSIGKLMVLEAAMKYQQVSLSPEDAQLLESRQFQVQDIGRWLGVPSILLNQADTTAWGSGIEQILDGFYKLTIRPNLILIEQAITAQVLTPQQRANFVVEFNFEALLRAIAKDRYEIYAKAVQNGLKTRNEVRALENDPPLTGGDVLTAQTNLAPLDMLGKVKSNGTNSENTIAQ